MRNKKFIQIIVISIFFIFNSAVHAANEFNFDVTNIEILENGKIFKGKNRGKIETENGVVINANEFEYNQHTNILITTGNVKIQDTVNNYTIFSDEVIYNKNNEIIFTDGNSKAIDNNGKIITGVNFEYDRIQNVINGKYNVRLEDNIQNYILLTDEITYQKNQEKIYTNGKTEAIIKSKYNFKTENLVFLINENRLISDKRSIIKDNYSNIYQLDSFDYLINTEQLKGYNIIITTNFDLPESDKFYFADAIINLENKDFIAKDTKIEIHRSVFGNNKNNPRLKGISSRKDSNITTVKKGIFTSCGENEKCPPWSITSKTIKHDKNKRQLIYDHAFLKIYDVPVFYFPKFFHPDPSVDRQSGLLKPQLNYSSILGSSITLPYFFAAAEDKDYTFTPSVFDKNILMLQTEFRKVNKNSNFIADFSFTNGYESELTKEKNSISHFFGEYNSKLDLEKFQSSKVNLVLEKVTNDTYLKVFDSHITKSKLRPENFDVLNSSLKLDFVHEDYNLSAGMQVYENLQLKNSDRYQYVFPYYNFDKILSQNFLNGSLNLISSGTNELKNTNNLRSNITNDISYKGFDLLNDNGLVSNFNINFKNLNSVAKNDPNYKSSPQVEAMSEFEFVSSIPMLKKNNKYEKYLTPKMSFRINPSDMKNYSDEDRQVDVGNIFENNRLGLGDSFEAGRSLTLGVDYRKKSLENINKYFDFKLATVLRDKEENFLPKASTLNRKNSNIFGSISTNLTEYLNINYNFAVDNDIRSFERNAIQASFSVNNFISNFNFIEEAGEMGDENVINNSTRYKIDESNFITFNTRRNRKINLTEYYDLVYQYENDCLTAGIKYKKTYYQDRDIKPTEDLIFTVTLVPLTTLEQRVDR